MNLSIEAIRKHCLSWQIAALTCLSLSTSAVLATSPTEFDVIGNTIIFNYPDWYQVQDSTGVTSLCEGSDPCSVPDGEYIVINHTINARFQVEVGTSNPVIGQAPAVLTYPSPGWYQVQDAETFESLCPHQESNCTVDPGSYIIINHTLGIRYEANLQEPTILRISPQYSAFDIESNVITFVAQGWFQVQRQYDYQTVCEGTEMCELSRDGVYQIINHQTGEVWTDVLVTGVGLTPAACSIAGGTLVEDRGDGFSFQPEYRCASGLPPIGAIVFSIEEQLEEGAVCCI